MRLLYFFAFLTLGLCACQPDKPSADTIYYNASIWTGDPEQPFATALALKEGSILFVGEDFQPYQGQETELVDVQGHLLVPGFMDNHTHFLDGGFQLASVELRAAQTPEDFIRLLAEFAHTLPNDGRWILGGNWDHEAWGGELPRREWIDSVTAGHPVFVSRLDGHMALASTQVLELAGITKDTPDPEGGTIIKDPLTGEPTGILKDEAMSVVYAILPDRTAAELDEALQRAVTHALSLGVTQVHDVGSFGGWPDLATYRRANKKGELHMRVYSFVPISSWGKLADYVAENGTGDDVLRWGALKGFVDGSLGSTTAWFYNPYDDEPQTSGLLVNDTTQLRNWILAADSAGLHIGVHAIGNRANDWLLNVYAEAIGRNGQRDRRFRIEHAQHLTREAMGRFAELGVIPSMQPYHAIDDGRWAEKRIGPERIKTTYPFRSLLDAGASLTFGSDWTVAPLNPLEGIYAAVTRRTLDGANPKGWMPQEKISVEEALRCYTAANAYAGYQEGRLGVLKPGYRADFVILSENIFEVAPERIKEVEVLRTVVNGEAVYVK